MKLSEVHDLRRLVRVRCNYCRRTRYYEPGDMQILLGNVEVDSLIGRLMCEDCSHRDATEVQAVEPTATERMTIRVRRLVRVDIIRRPVWKEN
ncbi:hypothetical protein [Aureimonas sp. AU40]|uniref:hypothetical protein n=1 Tax=Aureimonas sp. AU40 TaxID=1637747 RepID=UPI0007844A72|nr:hypothetical protein [Aureimonas sp. AU40]